MKVQVVPVLVVVLDTQITIHQQAMRQHQIVRLVTTIALGLLHIVSNAEEHDEACGEHEATPGPSEIAKAQLAGVRGSRHTANQREPLRPAIVGGR